MERKGGEACQGFSKRITPFLFLFFVRLLENSRTLEGHDPKEYQCHNAEHKCGRAGIFAANHTFFPRPLPPFLSTLGLASLVLMVFKRDRDFNLN